MLKGLRRARLASLARRRAVPLLACAYLALAALPSACHRRAQADEGGASAPKTELPSLSVKADTPNLLLTWVDDKGDFHVVDKPADVPAEARGTVRVVVTDKEAGTGDQIYVANLNETAADGTYRLKSMARSAWDELGASRRKARLEALAPASAAPVAQNSAPTSANGAHAPLSSVVAIIYGASWCKPCHDAEAYLRQRGVNVIKKDIEQSEAAADEMRQKLSRSGMPGASIPVIDVMGHIMVGFSPTALDSALAAAQSSKAL